MWLQIIRSTAGQLVDVIREVLTARRKQMLDYKPLVGSEFVPALAKLDPLLPEQEIEFEAWGQKTPLGKKLHALNNPSEDGDDGGKKKKGKGKKKKKK